MSDGEDRLQGTCALYGLPVFTSKYFPGEVFVMDWREAKKLSTPDLNKALADQLVSGRPRPQYPVYYVAYEHIDGSYRPVAATDLSGTTNINFAGVLESNQDWLRQRVDEIVAVGSRGLPR